MDIVTKAEVFARAAHGAIDQRRKYDGSAYVNHCAEVASILVRYAQWPVSQEQIAAAWLHDTVEDTRITLDDIRDVFGAEVELLVEALTDVSRPEDGPRRIRKEKDRQHTAESSPDAKSVKLADLISNSISIAEHDPDFARVYLKEKALLLEVMQDGDPGLLAKAYEVLQASREKIYSTPKSSP